MERQEGDQSVLHRQNMNQLFSLELFRVSSHGAYVGGGGFPLSNAILQKGFRYLWKSERTKAPLGP